MNRNTAWIVELVTACSHSDSLYGHPWASVRFRNTLWRPKIRSLQEKPVGSSEILSQLLLLGNAYSFYDDNLQFFFQLSVDDRAPQAMYYQHGNQGKEVSHCNSNSLQKSWSDVFLITCIVVTVLLGNDMWMTGAHINEHNECSHYQYENCLRPYNLQTVFTYVTSFN